MVPTNDKISVCVRVRPLSNRERKSVVSRVAWRWGEEEQQPQKEDQPSPTKSFIEQIWFPPGQQTRVRSTFYFDRLFGPKIHTAPVYTAVGANIVASAIAGYHGAIFCYGQTSTGKTYTMNGSKNHPGLIPLAVDDVFQHIALLREKQFVLRVSYLEIYNETVNDLLRPSSMNLRIFDDPQLGVLIKGLEETLVVSQEQVFSLIAAGESHRHIGATNFNHRSSRSHTIFRLIIESRERTRTPGIGHHTGIAEEGDRQDGTAALVSTLSLVDLAGSECATGTKRSKSRRREGGYINKSLLTLSHIILRLSDAAAKGTDTGNNNHLPYRDSKLTRILKPALDGDSKMSIICTLTPSAASFGESLNTLKFASRAKKIKSNAVVNKVEDETALIIRYQHEIAKLKAELETAQMEAKNAKSSTGTGVGPAPRSSGRPLPPRLSREDALANRELRNALKQAIANIGRVILNSQTKPSTKKKHNGRKHSEQNKRWTNKTKPRKNSPLRASTMGGSSSSSKQSAGEPAGELMVQTEKLNTNNINKKEREEEEEEEEEEENGSSSSSSVDEDVSSGSDDDTVHCVPHHRQPPLAPDSSVKLTQMTSSSHVKVDTPTSIRQSTVNTEPSFFHTNRGALSFSLKDQQQQLQQQQQLHQPSQSTDSNIEKQSSNEKNSFSSSPLASPLASPRSLAVSRESLDDFTDDENQLTLSPSALITRKKMIQQSEKQKNKESIQSELDEIRAHLVDLLQQMARTEETDQDIEPPQRYNSAPVQSSKLSTSPPFLLENRTPQPPQPPQPPHPPQPPQPYSNQTDFDLKRQVLYLQHQVEEQALKFSVSQADSSFLTDVLAKKDQILQECQALLVELDARHHQLFTRNAELEKIIAVKDKEINTLKQQLLHSTIQIEPMEGSAKSAALQNVDIATSMPMNKNMRRNVDGGGSTLDNSASSPSYESLMEKIMKLQEANNSPVVKRVTNVAVAAVHWKVQTKNKPPQNICNWQKTDDRVVVAGGVLLEVEGDQELVL